MPFLRGKKFKVQNNAQWILTQTWKIKKENVENSGGSLERAVHWVTTYKKQCLN